MSNHRPQQWTWTASLLDTPVGRDTASRWVLWRPGLDPKELFGRALPPSLVKWFSPAFAIIFALMTWAALCIYFLFGYMRILDSADWWRPFVGGLIIAFVVLPASAGICESLFRRWPETKGVTKTIGLRWLNSTAKKGGSFYSEDNWAHEHRAAEAANLMIKSLDQVQTSRAIKENWIDAKILHEMHELAWNTFEMTTQLDDPEDRIIALGTSAAKLGEVASNIMEIDNLRNEQERQQKDEALNEQYRTAQERADALATRLKAIRDFYAGQGE